MQSVSSAAVELSELYRRLPVHDEATIRVLEITPGAWSADVHIFLRTVRLESAPQYEALSYTWGSSEEGRTVCVNKKATLPVSDNLFRALRRLRKKFGSRTLWIDAICINPDRCW